MLVSAPRLAAPLALLWLGAGSAWADGDTAASAKANSDKLVVTVAGDVAWPDGWGGIDQIDAQKDKLFDLVRPILDTGDLNFANIECPLTETKAVLRKTYPITCTPKRLTYALDAGFNLLSLANNHALDAGEQGLVDTRALLRQTAAAGRRVWWAGTGATSEEALQPATFALPGKRARVAFFAVANSHATSVVASFNDPGLTERVAAAAREADIVLVSIHYGPEYIHVPAASTVERYHALIDAGADAVIAHHPHVVQGVERYKGGIIFYSLGNFSFGSKTRRHLETGARMYSMMGRLTFRGGQVAQVELIPLYANNSAKWRLGDETLEPRHATPQLLAGAFAQSAMEEFEAFAGAVPGAQPTQLNRVGDRLFVDLGSGPPSGVRQVALLHEQLHDFAAGELIGAGPRPATPEEMAWQNRAGTPLHAQPAGEAADTRAAKRGTAKAKAKAKRAARSRRASRARRGRSSAASTRRARAPRRR